jgi:hypothetical protein
MPRRKLVRRSRPRAGTLTGTFGAPAALAGLIGLAGLLGILGCGPTAEQQAEDRAAIEQLLAAYLPALGRAYATGDTEPLAAWAAPKEVLSADKRIRDLVRDGREVHPVLQQLTVERVDVYQYSNAYVGTIEIWDVKVFVAGTERLLSEQAGQVNRVRYQLKRTDQGWRILYRELAQGPQAG